MVQFSQCLDVNIKKKKISVELLNVHTIKPLNKILIKSLKKYKKIVTVEEHTIIGGLGSIVSEILTTNNLKSELLKIALPDKFGPTGDYNYLLDFHGLVDKKITKKIFNFL